MYLCIVFFIVLDLRLTKVGTWRSPFFCAHTPTDKCRGFGLTNQSCNRGWTGRRCCGCCSARRRTDCQKTCTNSLLLSSDRSYNGHRTRSCSLRMTNRRVQTGQQDGTFRGCHSHYRYHRSLGDTLPETGREAGGKRVFRRGGRGVSPYPRRIQRPLQTITAPAAKYCMGRCKVLHRTLKTYSSSFPSRNCLITG